MWGMRRDDFRLLMVFAVFLALLIVWAWPDGVPASAVWGAKSMPVQSAK